MSNNLADGIVLDDQTSFREWATNLLPWLNEAMHYVAEGIGGDTKEILRRQEIYTGYAGRLVEIYSQAETYRVTALAEAMDKQIKRGVSASLVARIAEGEITNQTKVYNAVHRLNSTLSDQLMAIASRLKFEKAINFGNQPVNGNRLEDMPFYQV